LKQLFNETFSKIGNVSRDWKTVVACSNFVVGVLDFIGLEWRPTHQKSISDYANTPNIDFI